MSNARGDSKEDIPFNIFLYLLDDAYTRLQGCLQTTEAVNKGELAQPAIPLVQRALTVIGTELDRLSTRTVVFDEVPHD